MRLTIVGTGPACPNPGGATSGYLVSEGNSHLLVDCGHGVAGAFQTYVPIPDLGAIIISHMHPDHYFDLFPLTYGVQFTGRNRIQLFLPPEGHTELERVRQALGLDETFFSDAFEVAEYDPDRDLEVVGLEIRFAPTRHFIPAWAMTFTPRDGGSVLAYGADTAQVDTVQSLIKGVDVAILEGTEPSTPGTNPSAGHLSARLAGELAKEAGVKRLVLTHYWHSAAEERLREVMKAFGGAAFLARQGDIYDL